MSLNEQQQAAYDGILKEFQGRRGRAAILTGAAGTGKTWLCNELAKVLNPKLCAMTHKACAVMSMATGEDVVTLAKLLKKRKFNDHNTGDTKFKSSGAAMDLGPITDTIFIDECSMMGRDDYKEVVDILLPNYNVLFIGDAFQLPPVKEAYSESLAQHVPKFELMEPVRFDPNSGIAATAVSIRTAMKEQLDSVPGMREILQQFSDVSYVSEAEAVQGMIHDFSAAESVDDVRMVSFTNARVDQFNYHLKQAVTGDSGKFAVKDILVANSAFSQMVGDEETIVLQNNQQIRVHSVREGTHLGRDCYFINELPVAKDRVAHVNEIAALKRQALSFPNGSKERKIAFAKMFKLQDGFADLRVSYAQTVHKAQGSTYQTVYFDLDSLDSTSALGRRLLYTGVTRAARRLVLFKS